MGYVDDPLRVAPLVARRAAAFAAVVAALLAAAALTATLPPVLVVAFAAVFVADLPAVKVPDLAAGAALVVWLTALELERRALAAPVRAR